MDIFELFNLTLDLCFIIVDTKFGHETSESRSYYDSLPVRTGAVAGAGRASGAAVKIGAWFLMSRDERIFFTEGDGVVGYQEIPCVGVVSDWEVAFELQSPMLAGRRGNEL